MAASTASRDARRQDGQLLAYPVKATTVIYKGTLVGVDATGYLRPMADAAGLVFKGVAYEKADNSAGAAGAVTCRVYRDGVFSLAYTGGDATQAKVGLEAYCQDDQSVDEDAALTTNDVKVGSIQEVVSAGVVRIDIGAYVR